MWNVLSVACADLRGSPPLRLADVLKLPARIGKKYLPPDSVRLNAAQVCLAMQVPVVVHHEREGRGSEHHNRRTVAWSGGVAASATGEPAVGSGTSDSILDAGDGQSDCSLEEGEIDERRPSRLPSRHPPVPAPGASVPPPAAAVLPPRNSAQVRGVKQRVLEVFKPRVDPTGEAAASKRKRHAKKTAQPSTSHPGRGPPHGGAGAEPDADIDTTAANATAEATKGRRRHHHRTKPSIWKEDDPLEQPSIDDAALRAMKPGVYTWDTVRVPLSCPSACLSLVADLLSCLRLQVRTACERDASLIDTVLMCDVGAINCVTVPNTASRQLPDGGNFTNAQYYNLLHGACPAACCTVAA